MKATLVRPPVDILEKFSKPIECLGTAYCAQAAREAGAEVTMVDAMISGDDIDTTAQQVLVSAPDLVGITCVLNHFPSSIPPLASALRAGGFDGPLLIGGHAVSFFPDRILRSVPLVDGVVCGEGEPAISEIVRLMQRGEDFRSAPNLAYRHGDEIHRNPVERVPDLNQLPLPARDLTVSLIDHDGLAAISTSRGCYARCTFCSVPRFYGLSKGRNLAVGDWRARSVDLVVDEVLLLAERHNVRELLFVDDEFFGGTQAGVERAVALGRRLEAVGSPVEFAISCRAENAGVEQLAALAAGGLRHVFVGLESGDAATLKMLAKGHDPSQNAKAVQNIKSLGLSFQPGFMLFNYKTTLEQLWANIDFLEAIGECKPVTLNSSVDPHFGTPVARYMDRDGVLVDNELALEFTYVDPRVALARSVVSTVSDGFGEWMYLIAALQSAVTYEWRRSVPGRSATIASRISQFEEAVNTAFVDVVKAALWSIEGRSLPSQAQVNEDTTSAVEDVSRQLKVQFAVLAAAIQREEGKLHYWTQNEVYGRAAAH